MRKKILLATIAFLFGTLLAWAGGTPSLPLNYQARIINGKFYVVRMLASPDPAPQGTFINSRGLRVDGAGTLYAISPAMAASPTIINSILGVAVDANGYLIVSVSGGGSMTWPASAGVAVYGGASAWSGSLATSGSGSTLCLTVSCIMTTPNLGTPSYLNAANITNVPCGALPALTGGVTSSAGSCATTLTVGPGGIGGTTANAVGADGYANVVNFGAVSDLTVVQDGAMAASATAMAANGSSTAPATPSGTTSFNSEVVVSILFVEGTLSVKPSTPTQRVYIVGVGYTNDGIFIGDQTVATAGSFSANTGTQSTAPWGALAIPLIPTSGNSISYINNSNGYSNVSSGPSTFTMTEPTGLSAGQTMIACVSFFPGNPTAYYYATMPGWSIISTASHTGSGGVRGQCWSRVVTSSEPAGGYAVSINNAAGQTAGYPAWGIVAYSNVAALDTYLSSVSAGFVSGSAGKLICIAGADPTVLAGVNLAACSTIGVVSGNNAYTLMGNASASALSSDEIRFGTDNTPAFTTAISTLTAASTPGGVVFVPKGSFAIQSGIAFPYNKVVTIQGAANAITNYKEPGTVFTTVPPSGTTIGVLGDGAIASAAMIFPPNTTAGDAWVWTPYGQVSGFTLWAGAGAAGSAGLSPDGIDIFSQHLAVNGVSTANFPADGMKISDNNGTTSSYTALITVQNCMSLFNLGAGMEITGSGNLNQNIEVSGCQLVDNGTYGLEIDGTPLYNGVFDNNIFQWNNQSGLGTSTGAGAGYEVYISQPVDGTVFRSNWFEDEKAYTNGMWIGGARCPSIQDNIFLFSEGSSPLYASSTFGCDVRHNTTYGQTILFNSSSTFTQSTFDNSNRENTATHGLLYASISGTAGTASCEENMLAGQTMATCYLNAYQETSTAQTWIFPIAFVTTPAKVETGSAGICGGGAYSSSVTSTVLTLPANAAMTAETCQVVITGQTN